MQLTVSNDNINMIQTILLDEWVKSKMYKIFEIEY